MNLRSCIALAFFVLMGSALCAGPKVTDAWIRETLPGQDMTAAYMVIENPDHSADFLTGASCDCAETVEVHTMAHTDGKMMMAPVKRLEIPSGGKVEMKPGGNHLMLFGVKVGLKEGAKATITLRFETAGDVKVAVVARSAEGKKNAQ